MFYRRLAATCSSMYVVACMRAIASPRHASAGNKSCENIFYADERRSNSGEPNESAFGKSPYGFCTVISLKQLS